MTGDIKGFELRQYQVPGLTPCLRPLISTNCNAHLRVRGPVHVFGGPIFIGRADEAEHK